MSKQPNNNYTAVQLAILAFLTYACVYAFRKPFTIAEYKGISFVGISYQTLLIISQATGYFLSKFTGIKVISELERRRRRPLFIFLILMAWFSLFMLALVPPPFGVFCLLINGYSLGFTWGIVFSYVEGRKMTDLIGAIMAVSFIFSGGFTRTIAVAIKLQWKLEEQWVGFFSGMFFLIPLLFFIFLLDTMPVPSLTDIAERRERMPMFLKDRREFLKLFGIGLSLIVFSYVLLTVMRDIRDNYMFSIWSELGYGRSPALFTVTESITSIVVLCLMAMIVFIRDHYRAYILSHWVVIAGFFISACASILFKLTLIDGALWMQLIGLGLYAGYIPFNCILFERFISAFQVKGNVGFLMYYADSFGYLGSLLIMIFKEWMQISIQWVDFYLILAGIVSTTGILTTLFSIRFFGKKYKLIL